LTFGREFTQAVELKQVAQQDAEKARFLVEKAEQIKQAAIITAEGDTQAALLIATAMGKLEKLCQIDKGGFKSEGAGMLDDFYFSKKIFCQITTLIIFSILKCLCSGW
jgi:hypothetical protein